MKGTHMEPEANHSDVNSTVQVNPYRLFIASRVAIATTAAAFVVIGAIMASLKEYFVLTNARSAG